MYWECVVIYVKNLMVALRRASSAMEEIIHVYTLKEEKKTKKCFGPPGMYLGTKIHKFREKDADEDQYCWSIPGDHYAKNIVAHVEDKLMNHGCQLNAKQQSPFTTGYIPEIGCLRWAVELGRADIAAEVALLLPR